MSENNRPQGWGKEHTLPDNWGKQSSDLEIKTLSGGVSMSSSEPDRKSDIEAEDKVSFSDKARSGAGKLAGIAKKVGGAAKNAAGNAVEYAKSDEAKEKLNAAKSKMKSIADGAGSAFTDLKEKTGDTINEHRSSKVESALSANDISDNVIDDTFAFDTYEETSSDIVQPENSYDDRIDVSDLNPALDSEIDTFENAAFPADRQEIPDTSTEDAVDSAWGNSSSPFKKNKPVTSPETNTKTSARSESVTLDTNNKANDDSIHDNPIQNVEQPESISSPAPNLNVPPNPGYVKQKQKTSPILIIVIIVLVLVIGVLGCMFFMMIKDKKSGTSDEFSAVSDAVETTAEITEAPTESKTKTTTAATTTPVESTTQTTSSIPDQYSSEEISAMSSAYIAENPDPNRNYENADYGYALIDLNNDGVQELLITYDEVEAGSPGVTGIFNINNNSLESIWISDFRTLGKLCEDNYIYTSAIYGQGYGIFIYKYFSAGSFENIESIEYNASIGSDKALHNGSEVSQIEAEEILAKYNAKKFKTKPLIVNIQPTTSAPIETYAFYGIVATESDSLNLRDKPSTDSNVIVQLPKGTKASVYYVEGYSDWYKIYTDNGYEGYVAAQYMKEYNESSNNNDTPYVSGMQTPWGTFTYSNFSESDYDSYTIYDPASVGIYLNCDIDSFNSNHSDYRIDNIAFWIVKHSTENKPHNYDMGITIMGTVLSKNERNINIEAYLINESTGEKIGGNVEMRLEANLYSGETFCFDSISYNMWETFRDIWDNSSYTLVLE